MATQIIILAAGLGKRMNSRIPKMLHTIAGKPLLEHVICTALSITPDTAPIVVCGHQSERIKEALSHYHACFVEQKEQLGTGHAVLQTLQSIDANKIDRVLILYGDVPLISTTTLKKLLQQTDGHSIGLLTASLPDPTGYGRIVRDDNGAIVSIIEEKDADANIKKITEINPGIYVVTLSDLQKWLPQIQNHNAQQEYYLTDIILQAKQENKTIASVFVDTYQEILGVNDGVQLSFLERFYQQREAQKLLRQGVKIYDPARLDIRGNVQIGKDVVLDINVILEGDVVIGDGSQIGPNCHLRNTHLADDVEIKAFSVLDGVEIGTGAIIGPFARLRPGSVLANGVHVGNFVEIKNSYIDANSKVNHLSYIGDSEIGKRVNVGAGTITCNYDGANKHKTIIGDDVHIGSDTQLVAPVTVGEGATIGAGSTITKQVPAKQLTVTHRLMQRSIDTWKRPNKKEIE